MLSFWGVVRCDENKKRKFWNQAVKTEYGKIEAGWIILAAPDINKFFYHLLHDHVHLKKRDDAWRFSQSRKTRQHMPKYF